MSDLIQRRYQLEKQTDIKDIQAYSMEWRKLAADFRALGMTSNADLCDSKAAHYSGLGSGEFRRHETDYGFIEIFPLYAYGETSLILSSDIYIPAFAGEEQGQ